MIKVFKVENDSTVLFQTFMSYTKTRTFSKCISKCIVTSKVWARKTLDISRVFLGLGDNTQFLLFANVLKILFHFGF